MPSRGRANSSLLSPHSLLLSSSPLFARPTPHKQTKKLIAPSPVFNFDQRSPPKAYINPSSRSLNLLLFPLTPHFSSLTKIRDELSHEWTGSLNSRSPECYAGTVLRSINHPCPVLCGIGGREGISVEEKRGQLKGRCLLSYVEGFAGSMHVDDMG